MMPDLQIQHRFLVGWGKVTDVWHVVTRRRCCPFIDDFMHSENMPD